MAKAVSNLIAKAPGMLKGAVDYSRPRLTEFVKYAKVELVPPTPAEFPQVVQGFNKLVHSAKTGAWKNLSVREGWLNTLIAMEITFWFFVGECIAKRNLVGYDV